MGVRQHWIGGVAVTLFSLAACAARGAGADASSDDLAILRNYLAALEQGRTSEARDLASPGCQELPGASLFRSESGQFTVSETAWQPVPVDAASERRWRVTVRGHGADGASRERRDEIAMAQGGAGWRVRCAAAPDAGGGAPSALPAPRGVEAAGVWPPTHCPANALSRPWGCQCQEGRVLLNDDGVLRCDGAAARDAEAGAGWQSEVDQHTHPFREWTFFVTTRAAVPPTERRTLEPLERACAQGDGASCWLAGERLLRGAGTARDDEAALARFDRACALRRSEGCVAAGWMREQPGANTPAWRLAVDKHAAACALGSALGCANEAALRLVDARDRERQEAQMAALRAACERDVPVACSNLAGATYELRTELPAAQRREQASAVLRPLCAQGELAACSYLGLLAADDGLRLAASSESYGLFRRACGGGEMEACHRLGRSYQIALGVARNEAYGTALMRAACDGGAPLACVNIGIAALNAHNYAVARYLGGGGCARGSQKGCVTLATALEHDESPDFDRIAGILQTACEFGESHACTEGLLASIRGTGPGTSSIALARVQQSCEGGGYLACAALVGVALQEPRGAVQRYPRVVAVLRDHCAQRSFGACLALGRLYEADVSDPAHGQRAVAAYRDACNDGDEGCCVNLSTLLLNGRSGVPRNEAEARRILTRVCRPERADACSNLGVMLIEGRGGPPDLARAHQLLVQSCEHGGGHGCSELATTYLEGRGVERDPARAQQYFRRACELGHVRACTYAASVSDPGGAGPSDDIPVEVLERNCARNDTNACALFALKLLTGTDVAPDLPRGVQIVRRICDLRDQSGCTILGSLYMVGYRGVVPLDPARGRRLIQQACDGGYQLACRVLSGESPGVALPDLP